MAFTNSWDEAKPAGTDAIALGDDQIRQAKLDIRERFNVEHDFPSATGKLRHKFGRGTTAARDAITDWVIGSIWYNTDAFAGKTILQIVTAVGPVTWVNIAGMFPSTAPGDIVGSGTVITETSTTFVDVPALSATITTLGSPVIIQASITVGIDGTSNGFEAQILIDAVAKIALRRQFFGGPATGLGDSLTLSWLEAMAAGSHTFKVQWRSLTGGQIATLNTGLTNRMLWVLEYTPR